jgi:hypothetical protein
LAEQGIFSVIIALNSLPSARRRTYLLTCDATI